MSLSVSSLSLCGRFLYQSCFSNSVTTYSLALLTDSYQSLSQRVKSLFSNIRDLKIVAGKIQPKINGFGLEAKIDSNEAYQTVQSILALYPSQMYKKPTYENYIQLLKNQVKYKPFLQDVVDKLEKETDKGFRSLFVANMTKQYNNTSMVTIGLKGETKLVSSDSRNSVS